MARPLRFGETLLREGIGGAVWVFGLWLRKHVPLFQEERLLGRTLIFLRALWQIPACVLSEPSLLSLRKARLCLRLCRRHTMVSPRLLFRMYDLAAEIAASGVEGTVVECGVWNGGSAALLASALHERAGLGEAWLFDSFQGLPEPTERDPEPVRVHYYRGWNTGTVASVRAIWRDLELPEESLRVRSGWFRDSFPRAPIRSISILHIDCDWYESVLLSLEHWYDRVTPGGIIILNDYNLYSGANAAVRDFLARRGEPVQIHLLGRAGAWFTKAIDGRCAAPRPRRRRRRLPLRGLEPARSAAGSRRVAERPIGHRGGRRRTDSGMGRW